MIESKPNLYVVRHAQSLQNIHNNLDRDSSLSDLGIKQAVDAGLKLRSILGDQEPKAFIHTGLKRTIDTAEAIKMAGNFTNPLVEMTEFREREIGIYHQMEFPQLLEKNPHMEPIYKQYQGSCIWFLEGNKDEGVESLTEMKERIALGVEKIHDQFANKPVVVIGHAGSIKIIRYLYEEDQNSELANYLASYVPKNCEIYFQNNESQHILISPS